MLVGTYRMSEIEFYLTTYKANALPGVGNLRFQSLMWLHMQLFGSFATAPAAELTAEGAANDITLCGKNLIKIL